MSSTPQCHKLLYAHTYIRPCIYTPTYTRLLLFGHLHVAILPWRCGQNRAVGKHQTIVTHLPVFQKRVVTDLLKRGIQPDAANLKVLFLRAVGRKVLAEAILGELGHGSLHAPLGRRAGKKISTSSLHGETMGNGIFLVQIQRFPAQVGFMWPLVGLVFCQDRVHCMVLNKLQKKPTKTTFTPCFLDLPWIPICSSPENKASLLPIPKKQTLHRTSVRTYLSL